MAIVLAAREAILSGGEVTMPEVARRALVSEATAYRYFADLTSLLREALAGVFAGRPATLDAITERDDPVERVGVATRTLLTEVVAYQGAVRALIAASIIRPGAEVRPARRFGLIDEALRPLETTLAVTDPDRFAQLKRDLAVVVSAEALFTLTDLCDLDPEAAITSAVTTARTLTTAALAGAERL
jgi:AcrR family transcriptional regulator